MTINYVSKPGNMGAGYVSLAEDVLSFSAAGCLPNSLDISRLIDGDNVEATLLRYSAKFHVACRLQYSKTRLERAVKRKRTEPQSSTDSGAKQARVERHNRQHSTTKVSVCLFCEEFGTPSKPLHEAMTKVVGERVKSCATQLLDEKLFAKVSSGDLVASEAKYHAKCLIALYNAAARRNIPDQTTSTKDQALEAHHARAFAELFAFIDDALANRREQGTSPVFKLSDLIHLYNNRLTQLGIASPSIHSTRLKDRILANFPELHAFKEGRDVLSTSTSHIGAVVRKACETDADDDAIILARAARIIRKEIQSTSSQFNGSFSENCQAEALPPSLVTLIAMLLYGANITEQSLVTQTQALLSICQLLLFNTSTRSPNEMQTGRHNRSREPPLPVYLEILLHNKTRKRQLVQTLFDLGLSVSYDRVLESSTNMGTKVCTYYDRLNTVCPPHMKRGVFTTSAVDNINHQTSATTARGSVNGTGISVFQQFQQDHA